MYKVFIVDDHAVVARGIESLIKQDVPNANSWILHSAEEALRFAAGEKIDMLITDIRLPGISGIELIKRLREIYPAMKVIVISMYDQAWRLQELLKLKVNGVVYKSCPMEEHSLAIRSVMEGKDYFSSGVKITMMNLHRNSPVFHLTRREEQVLLLIHQGASTGQIATQLSISPNTIETYRKSLLKKLNVKNSGGLVSKALELGILEM